jgi:hypothetical protein
MKIIQRIMFIFLSILLMLITAGCDQHNTAFTTETDTSNPQQIIKDVISGLQYITAYQSESSATMLYEIISESTPYEQTKLWKTEKYVNLKDRELSKQVNIDSDITGIFIKDYRVIKKYAAGDTFYSAVQIHGLHPSNLWNETSLTDKEWNYEEGVIFDNLVDLFKTSSYTNLVGRETFDGTDCYILEIIPSSEALIEWTLLQNEQGNREEISFGYQGAGLWGKDNLELADIDSKIKVWISAENKLPIKIDIDITYTALPENFKDGESFEKIIRTMQGTIIFSNYNDVISIELLQ